MRLLIVSQVYLPDPAAVGQYLASAAEALAARGATVRVLTAGQGYDDPSARHPRRETLRGVKVRRLPFSSFGKRSLPVRLAGMLSFLLQACLHALFTPRLDALLVSTSPPMAGPVLAVIARLRRVPLAFWAMDLNPEQAVALGLTTPGHLSTRLFAAGNRLLHASASRIVVLDRFMAARLDQRSPRRPPTKILPPWPLEADRIGAGDGTAFRRTHGLEGKFIVMHSGNHSLAHPLSTVLDAARLLRDDPRLHFVFVGGGVGKREVEHAVREGLPNLLSLPYQPLQNLADTLAAADVHLVAMGESMVGCVHPCKVYGGLSAGRPLLYLGPALSHLGELVSAGAGRRIDHGDVPAAVAALRQLASLPAAELAALGAANRRLATTTFDPASLRADFCAFIESMVPPSTPGSDNP